ncbi:MAG TPA: MFS transporter [Candidatus Copromorpha excrementigallinarum]|uniref:MFS transporter n=1 Tax=Candidatus Allocopromorpha excrementigallinarum TaxID=2840742 RepID=A0A9D1L5D3_9FIRM|nr:MFS transporter [Candidatus Copromorpha excrementigallinarum]
MKEKTIAYQNGITALFFLTWGFMFIDRLAISFVFPVIVPDLNLTNGQVGTVNMSFTIMWGVSAIVVCAIADKVGNLKMWLIVSGFLTAIFGGCCALANSYEMLLVLRALVGIAEGPFSTFIMSALGKSVSGERLGVSVGIVNAGVAVIASTLGPVLLTQLVAVTTWQTAFIIAAAPGFILIIFVAVFLHPIPDEKKEDIATEEAKKKGMFKELWGYRNFRTCFFLAMTHMSGYYIIQIYASLYWTEIAGISVQTAGFLISAAGFAGIFWCIFLPKLSDNFGRRSILAISYIASILVPLAMWLIPGATVSMVLYALFSSVPGAVGIFWINLIPMESLPPYLTSTGISIPMAMGEFIGGALITTIAGFVADAVGLSNMMVLAACGYALSIALALVVKECAPRVLARKAEKEGQLSG